MMISADDVTARLGRPLTDTETARLDGLTAEATALVNGWLHHTPDTIGDEIRIVVSRIVARALAANTDPGVLNTGATMGPFAVTRAYTPDATNGGVWLTRVDKAILRQYARRGMVGNVAT